MGCVQRHHNLMFIRLFVCHYCCHCYGLKIGLGEMFFSFYLTQEEDEDDEDGWMDGWIAPTIDRLDRLGWLIYWMDGYQHTRICHHAQVRRWCPVQRHSGRPGLHHGRLRQHGERKCRCHRLDWRRGGPIGWGKPMKTSFHTFCVFHMQYRIHWLIIVLVMFMFFRQGHVGYIGPPAKQPG